MSLFFVLLAVCLVGTNASSQRSEVLHICDESTWQLIVNGATSPFDSLQLCYLYACKYLIWLDDTNLLDALCLDSRLSLYFNLWVYGKPHVLHSVTVVDVAREDTQVT